MDIGERQRLVAQTKEEMLTKLRQYEVGICHDGDLVIKRDSNIDGHLFIIPFDKYEELFQVLE